MNKLIIAIFTLSLLGTTACQTNKGCTDPYSINYSSTADEDDGSCTYVSSLIFWFNTTTGIFMQDNYIEQLNVYVDGVLIGTMPANSSYESAPNCNEGGVTYNCDLGSEKTKTITFTIKYPFYYPEPGEYEYASGTLLLQGGHCQQYQIQ